MMKKVILVAVPAFAAVLLVSIPSEVPSQTRPGLMQKAPKAEPSEPQVEPEALLEKMQPRPAPPTASSPLRRSAAESAPGTPAQPPKQMQGFDQDVCGNTRCAIGESCVGGTTCCPDARICGGECCPEGSGCDPQTDQCTYCPNPTDTPCVVGGCCSAGKVCQDVEGFCCNPGEMCCDQVNCSGGCRPISECIK
jgi:hypothetical protein